MAMSNYGNFLDGVTIRGVPIHQYFPGKVFFVGNSSVAPVGGIKGSDSNKGTYNQPFGTLDYAIGRCVANRGDIICVLPGHAESLSTASAVAMDVAGVAVIGLGHGSLRPTFSFAGTAATFNISANNCVIRNLLFSGAIDAVVSPLVISGDDCDIEVAYVDSTGQCTDCIVANAADRLRLHIKEYRGDSAAGTNAAVALINCAGVEITADFIDGNFAVGGIDCRTTASSRIFVHDVLSYRNRNSADIFMVDTITASVGQIGPNINIRLADNAANITEAITGATFVVVDPVYVVNAPNEKAMLINWTASTDA